MIAGIGPKSTRRIASRSGSESLSYFDSTLASAPATIFTIAYDLGLKINGIESRHENEEEPDIFTTGFDALAFHDYSSRETFLEGEPAEVSRLRALLSAPALQAPDIGESAAGRVRLETSSEEYLERVESIRELIRAGETYQANLTQKFTVSLGDNSSGGEIFRKLKLEHPSAYSSFIDRGSDLVISISPERFLRVAGSRIETAPIKGTRKRTGNKAADAAAREELEASDKDRAENVMITDLLRNDLGRVCEFGSVRVDSLCAVEELPSLYHLVSTISGRLRPGTSITDVLRALFPCGSITGAPKHRTMQIIDTIEPSSRGLSMGAIGIHLDPRVFREFARRVGLDPADPKAQYYDLSVAIRTMVIRDGTAEFNTGGGVVIDSDPAKEYEESLDKASAILRALGAADPRSRTRSGT